MDNKSMFSQAAIKDKQEKISAEAQIKGQITEGPKKQKKDKKLNICITEESKAKIEAEAAKRGMSIAALIQLWIYENCN